MTRIRLVFIAALALAALPASQAGAVACTIVETTPILQLLPEDGETDVPIDSRIWLLVHDYSHYPDPPTALITLIDETGEVVETTPVGLIDSRDGAALSFAPDDGLAPDTRYRVEIDWDDRAGDHLPRMSFEFTTGDGPTASAPPVPEATRLETRTYPNNFDTYGCGNPGYVDSATVELRSEGRINLLVDGDRPTPDEDPFGAVADVRTALSLTLRGELPPTTRLALHAGTLDLAGNFSGWSEAIDTTMPAAGCDSSVELDQAALALGLLLLGGSLLRRLDGRALLPLVLAAAFTIPSIAPGAASAQEATATVQAPAQAADDWRAPLVRQLQTTEKIWGGALAATGGVQLGFAIALPFRAPQALSGTVATPMAWGGALSGLVTARILRHHLMTTESPERLRRHLLAGYLITAPITAASMVGVGVAFVLAAIFVDNHAGVSIGMLGLPMSLLSMNITLGVYAEKLRLMKKRQQVSTPRRPRPEVLAAGPTGLVVAF